MSTKAQSGLGSALSIGATPTVIGEIQSVKQSGCKWDTEDATNFQSVSKEVVATIQDWGELAIEAKRVSTDPGQVLVVAAFNSGATTSFTMSLPKEAGQTTTGDKYVFNAIVVECDAMSPDVSKLIPLSFKLKITGAPTFTEGA